MEKKPYCGLIVVGIILVIAMARMIYEIFSLPQDAGANTLLGLEAIVNILGMIFAAIAAILVVYIQRNSEIAEKISADADERNAITQYIRSTYLPNAQELANSCNSIEGDDEKCEYVLSGDEYLIEMDALAYKALDINLYIHLHNIGSITKKILEVNGRINKIRSDMNGLFLANAQHATSNTGQQETLLRSMLDSRAQLLAVRSAEAAKLQTEINFAQDELS